MPNIAIAAIAQKLGVYITEKEACALFGRYDTRKIGFLTYFEFITCFFDEVRCQKKTKCAFPKYMPS
jgi:hypothetical protein